MLELSKSFSKITSKLEDDSEAYLDLDIILMQESDRRSQFFLNLTKPQIVNNSE